MTTNNSGFDVSGITMSPKELKTELNWIFKMVREGVKTPSIYLEGKPGHGKTSIIQQTTTEFEFLYHEILLATVEPTDLTGIPALDVERALFKYCPEERFEAASTAYPDGPPTVFCLDDLPTAAPQVQAAAFKFVHERKAGPHQLRDNVVIIGAGNRESDNAGANSMPSALANRMLFYYVEADERDWIEWAVEAGVHPLVVAYIRRMPNRLVNFDPDAEEKPFTSPRSLHLLSDLMHWSDQTNRNLDFRTMAGTVGKGTALEIEAFISNAKSAVPIEEIIKDPKKARVPGDDNPDGLYATICNLEHFMGKKDGQKHLKTIAIYACRKEMMMELV